MELSESSRERDESPTRGLMSQIGVIPLSESQDTAGPITRTVEDAARMLDVMAGTILRIRSP